jgi:hypothetical protein
METGLPGEGLGEFIRDYRQFARLSEREKERIINRHLDKIYAYTRWMEVLDSLGLKYHQTRDNSSLLDEIHKRRGSGESPAHRTLKEYISRNPKVIGLSASVGKGRIEFCLPSGDSVDVLFVSERDWIAVEVKSRISDVADIYRGLYQCVKYQAVVEAFRCEKGQQPSCRALLVLEGEFPTELIEIKNVLGVEVIDRITK